MRLQGWKGVHLWQLACPREINTLAFHQTRAVHAQRDLMIAHCRAELRRSDLKPTIDPLNSCLLAARISFSQPAHQPEPANARRR